MVENKKKQTEKVFEGEIVDEKKQYRKFFSQLDDSNFSGLSRKTVFLGMLFLVIFFSVFMAILGGLLWLVFHLLPFIIAFLVLVILAVGIYLVSSYLYENFIKNIK